MTLEYAEKLLKRCPFCGDKRVLIHGNKTPGIYYVACEGCGTGTKNIQMSPEYSVYEILVSLWNTRYDEHANDGSPTNNFDKDAEIII